MKARLKYVVLALARNGVVLWDSDLRVQGEREVRGHGTAQPGLYEGCGHTHANNNNIDIIIYFD